MSLVVAYKREGVVYMGADTQSSYGTTIERALNESGFKISSLPNGVLLGMTGRVKAHQMILAHKELFDIPHGCAFNKRHIVKNIIPKLSKLMNEVVEDKDSCTSSMEVSVLVAYKEKLFYITRDFRVFDCNGYTAIGAGRDYVKYALSTIGGGDINESLLQALRTGAMFDSSVSAPYILIDTKDREYKIVEE